MVNKPNTFQATLDVEDPIVPPKEKKDKVHQGIVWLVEDESTFQGTKNESVAAHI